MNADKSATRVVILNGVEWIKCQILINLIRAEIRDFKLFLRGTA